MAIDSRQLFQQLMQRFTLEETKEEKEAVLFWLLEHELKLRKVDVLSGKKVKAEEDVLNKIIERLNQHEPLQYILGEAWFYGRKFKVNSSVLIPRPETEILVQTVVDRFRGKEQPITILDIGTGSGCIAITLALELPRAQVIGTDISSHALSVAEENADALHSSVQLIKHDILHTLLTLTQLDAVVSNPPYILEEEKPQMKKNVTGFEPHTALFVPDREPYLFYQAIVEKAKAALSPGGYLITEINERLGSGTSRLFHESGFVDVEIIKDLNGKERFVSGKKS